MRDNLLKYTICCSVGVHLALLGVIGKTSVNKPIDVEQLKIVRVDLVKTPEQINIAKPDQPKPEPVKTYEPPPVYVPPVQRLRSAPPPKPQTVRKVAAQAAAAQARAQQTRAAQPAGDPGGHLNMGTGSEHGDISLPSGATENGHVPSPVGGQGSGSGTGRGIGSSEPDPNASSGLGTTTAPPPPPPPPPKMDEITVCAKSHKLPGHYCQGKVKREYREGSGPTSICDECKPPEPVHKSTIADRAEPELIKSPEVKVPQSVIDEGIDARVTVTYTVEADGSVSDVKIADSSGNSALDRAVVEAAKGMKYKPAVQDGIPRAVKMRRTYHIRA